MAAIAYPIPAERRAAPRPGRRRTARRPAAAGRRHDAAPTPSGCPRPARARDPGPAVRRARRGRLARRRSPRRLRAPSLPPRPARPVYVVQPGDTLWTIARRAQPPATSVRLVGRLATALGDRPLQPGERIVLP